MPTPPIRTGDNRIGLSRGLRIRSRKSLADRRGWLSVRVEPGGYQQMILCSSRTPIIRTTGDRSMPTPPIRTGDRKLRKR